jgi:hypothetical protein
MLRSETDELRQYVQEVILSKNFIYHDMEQNDYSP